MKSVRSLTHLHGVTPKINKGITVYYTCRKVVEEQVIEKPTSQTSLKNK